MKDKHIERSDDPLFSSHFDDKINVLRKALIDRPAKSESMLFLEVQDISVNIVEKVYKGFGSCL